MHVIAISIGLTFLALQAAFLGSLWLYLVRERAGYRELLRTGAKSLPGGHAPHWAQWLDGRLWVGVGDPVSAIVPGQWTRDDALDELERSLNRHWAYHGLQRLAIGAPLIGVLITTIGFLYVYEPTSGDLNLQQIMGSIRPLFYGVFTGAVLALVNQLLLFLASWPSDAVRRTAVQWFDKVVWNHLPSTPEGAVHVTSRRLASLIGTVGKTARRCAAMARRFDATSAAMQQAAVNLTQDTQCLTHRMAEVCNVLSGVKPSLENFQSTIGGFEQVVTHQFQAAGQKFSVAADQLGAWFPRFEARLIELVRAGVTQQRPASCAPDVG